MDAKQEEDARSSKTKILGKRMMSMTGTKDLHAYAEEDPSIVPQFDRYVRALNSYMLAGRIAIETESTRGLWFYGPPGTGKSHAARQYENVYLKSQSKWWDGYSGEATVILDDLDSDCLAHYLKIWADKWSCTGETKGGTVPLQHTTFIVTSNYSIDDLFKDPEMRAAIARRFVVTHYLIPFN